jgi:hypothetical protein
MRFPAFIASEEKAADVATVEAVGRVVPPFVRHHRLPFGGFVIEFQAIKNRDRMQPTKTVPSKASSM